MFFQLSYFHNTSVVPEAIDVGNDKSVELAYSVPHETVCVVVDNKVNMYIAPFIGVPVGFANVVV